MKEIVLPSGAVLKLGKVPFSESKALFQVVTAEFREFAFNAHTDVAAIIKEVVCFAFSSKAVEPHLKACMARCLYNSGAPPADLKVEDSLFESDAAREDYVLVCAEVIEHVLRPFTKDLSVVFARLALTMQGSPKSKSTTIAT